ncbi:MAG: glycosyltransferase family A protein, partial [Armatimonadetes bacterium]|nr:glycosyltransferase family A protein [Armatimonadota bacterium]
MTQPGTPNPLVSILIPCYNAERWVGDAIRSALAQTYEPKEVVVVDDGSTDGSLDVLKSFGDAIRFESGPNRGACEARNRLTALSRGEWLQYLDADDYLMPDKIAKQMDVVQQTECDIVVSPWVTDTEGTLYVPDIRDPWVSLFDSRIGNTISNLWRKELVVAAGGWDPQQLRYEEGLLFVRMLEKGARVACCPTAIAVARSVNAASISHQGVPSAVRHGTLVIEEAITFLESTGEMTRERRTAAARHALRAARLLWDLGAAGWKEMERRARQLDPHIKAKLRRESRLYGFVYSAFGFRVAQAYLA